MEGGPPRNGEKPPKWEGGGQKWRGEPRRIPIWWGRGLEMGGSPIWGGVIIWGGAQMGGRTPKNEGGPQKWKGDPQISYVVGEGPGNGGVEG